MNPLTEWHLKMTENVNSVMTKMGAATGVQISKMDNLQNKVNEVGGVFNKLSSVIAVAGVGMFAGQALHEYEEAAAANAQMRASYLSTNAAVGASYEHLQGLSDKLASTSIYDDDDIAKAQSVLLTFTNIKGAVYDQALPAITDVASKMGGVESATIQIGKALNSPTEGITALTRVGVSFTQQQKDIIKHYEDIGQTAKAQQIMISELNKEFGGSAKAALDANPSIRINKQIKEIQETVGGVIMQLIVELKPAIMTITEVLKTGVEWLSANWTTIRDVFSAIYEGVKIATIIFSPFLVVMAALEAAIWLQNLAWLANPLIWIPAVVVGAIAAFTYLYRKVDWFRGGVQAIFAGLKAYFFGWFTFMKEMLFGLGTMLIGVLTLDVSQITRGFEMTKGAFVNYGKGIADAVATGYKSGSKEVQDQLKLDAGGKKKSVIEALGANAPSGASPSAGEELQGGLKGISDGGKAIKNVTVTINKLVESLVVKTENLSGMNTMDIQRAVEEILIRAVGGAEEAI